MKGKIGITITPTLCSITWVDETGDGKAYLGTGKNLKEAKEDLMDRHNKVYQRMADDLSVVREG